jgi:hypothetical protein
LVAHFNLYDSRIYSANDFEAEIYACYSRLNRRSNLS